MIDNIFSYFYNSYIKFKEKTALVVDNKSITYEHLKYKVGQICNVLKDIDEHNIGLFGSKTLTCYQGILGILASGKTYIPLNPKFPKERNKKIIDISKIKVLVSDENGLNQIVELIDELSQETIILFPNISKENIPKNIKEKFKIFYSEKMIVSIDNFKNFKQSKYAYIMFTSGSTGEPKGVPISHKNVFNYVNYLTKRYEINENDRFSQTFDLTFDLSVHDMFISWAVGASLYVVPQKELMAPAKYIKQNNITIWFSVPSLAMFMNKFRMLKENTFPKLRYSLFCGESLPKSLAISWQKAAPNSILENIYGPTETTIGITHYRIPIYEDKILEYNGIVSIGKVFDTHNFCIIDEQNNKTNNIGELCISGEQLSSGYYNNIEKNKQSFFSFSGEDIIYYKTGDIVKIDNENIYYISRKDFQIKIRGYRIELEEINTLIRDLTNCELVYTVPNYNNNKVIDKLYSFIDVNCLVDKKTIIKYLKSKLPEYMIPKDILYIKNFPLNNNGKVDLKELSRKINNNGDKR